MFAVAFLLFVWYEARQSQPTAFLLYRDQSYIGTLYNYESILLLWNAIDRAQFVEHLL